MSLTGTIISARARGKVDMHRIKCFDSRCEMHAVQGPGYGLIWASCGWFYWAPQP